MIVLHLGRVEWQANPRGSERESPHQLLSNKGSGFNKDSFLGKELMQPRPVVFVSVFSWDILCFKLRCAGRGR